MNVRWTSPAGEVAQEERVEQLRRPFIASTIEFGEEGVQPVGAWTVELLLDDDIIATHSVAVAP